MEQTVLLIQKFGKFESWEKVGEGAYGSTYRSRDPLLDRQVAVKAFHQELTAAPDFLEHFRREARQIASLRHPHIVNMIDGGEQDGQYYLVVEFLSGGTLNNLLKDNKPLSLARTIEILRPIADALDYAHSRRVIHRDLKPSNILFADDNHVVLTDFAIVKSSGRTPAGNSLGIIGTPEYLAPEQIMGGEASPETDIYALGVIAFQLLSGQPPFIGTPQQVYHAHLEQPLPDIRGFNPALPKEIQDALGRAMAKDPARRFGLAREFIDTLDQIAIRLSREQGRVLYQAAKDHMKLFQFDAAVAKLEQVLALRSTPEVEALLKECLRRKQIADEVQALRHQISQAQARIDMLLATETWMRNGSADHHREGNLLQKVVGGRK